MNSQQLSHLAGLSGGPVRTLAAGAAWPLGSSGGELKVLAGRVWLTQAGELADHVVEAGRTVRVAASRRAVIEAWDETRPARVVWRPRRALDRAGDALRVACARCWEIVDPARRIALGSLAAVAALVLGAVLFGPLSDARTRTLAEAAVLHNDADVRAAASRERPRVAAQEARRRAPGAA